MKVLLKTWEKKNEASSIIASQALCWRGLVAPDWGSMPSANATAVPSSLPTPLPTPLPSPVPSALFPSVVPSGSLAPSVLSCGAGFGLEVGALDCEACPAGRYSSGRDAEACVECAGGSVPSGGACFAGTARGSVARNGTGAFAHADRVLQRGESCYYFEPVGATWTAAERACNDLGGHLACVSGLGHATLLAGRDAGDSTSLQRGWSRSDAREAGMARFTARPER